LGSHQLLAADLVARNHGLPVDEVIQSTNFVPRPFSFVVLADGHHAASLNE
jgi:hypothetical protein